MDTSGRRDKWGEQSEDDRREPFLGEDDDDIVLPVGASTFQSRTPSQPDNLGDFLAPAPLSEVETIQLGKEAIRTFLSSRTVYDAMPKSSRVVIFDVSLGLKLVLYALLEHEIRGAPLWNPFVQRLVGMVTLSDFSDLFRHSLQTGENPYDILDAHTVQSWRNLVRQQGQSSNETEKGRACAASLAAEQQRNPKSDLIYVDPTASLLDACSILRNERVHRLPIIDPDMQTCLQVITFQSILEYLTTQFSEERRLFDQSIYALGVGTYAEPQTSTYMGRTAASPNVVYTASLETPLREVCNVFATQRISTIPIVDTATGKARDLYRRSYVASLNPQEADIFSWNMGQVLAQYEMNALDRLEPIHTCTPKHTLFQVFVLLAETKKRTLIIVDDNGKFLGICSLSDVLGHFL